MWGSDSSFLLDFSVVVLFPLVVRYLFLESWCSRMICCWVFFCLFVLFFFFFTPDLGAVCVLEEGNQSCLYPSVWEI